MTTRILCAGVLTWAAVAVAATPRSIASLETGFEAHGERRFLWRGKVADVTASVGGRVDFRAKSGSHVVLSFPGANLRAVPRGELATPVRYYSGTRSGSFDRFASLRFEALYPGINVVFRFEDGHLEYDFELEPGADPGRIRMSYRGAAVELNRSGDVEARAGELHLIQRRPVAFQVDRGARVPVACTYARLDDRDIAISVGRYNPALPLTIDPALNFSNVLPGSGFDAAYAIARDDSGIYIAGESDSLSPSSTASRRLSRDAFVAKLNPAGTAVLYMTYFGGAATDAAHGIAVDSTGAAYIIGTTASSDFPATFGAYSTAPAGLEDVFAAKFTAGGVRVWTTLLGSSGMDLGNAIAIDGSGVYVTGQTMGAFPTTSIAYQRTLRGLSNCFVSKLSLDGSSLIYSTLVGGTVFDGCRAIAVDSSAQAYVAGFTYSSDFPVAGAYQSTLRGTGDAFVTKLNAAGTALVFSTYFGGDAYDEANAIAIDGTGVYIAGATVSSNFPVDLYAYQTTLKGDYDAFLAKLDPTGAKRLYATYFGGRASDSALSLAVDAGHRTIIGGVTASANLPTKDAPQSVSGGSFDGFVAVFGASGSSLLMSSYAGGQGDDRIFGVAVDAANQIYASGHTQSSDFPRTTGSAPGYGNVDIFVSSVTYTVPTFTTAGYLFVPITPCRVVDTTNSAFGAVFGPPSYPRFSSRVFPFFDGNCGIPQSAKAYSLTFTILPKLSAGTFIAVWPVDQYYPGVSTVNSSDGRRISNAAIVPAGAGQGTRVYSDLETDMFIDTDGYFTDALDPNGLMFYPMVPCRVADTRFTIYGTGLGQPSMSAGSVRTFPVLNSNCSIPNTARAYSLNFTVLPPAGAALQGLTTWGAGRSQPSVTMMSSVKGAYFANANRVQAGLTNGAINVTVTDKTDVLFDINGYFAPPGSPGGLSFVPLAPCRVVDTRPNPMAASTSMAVDVLGSSCNVPPTAQAYSVNVTALPKAGLDWLSMWPNGLGYPGVSTLNSPDGATIANSAIIPAGTEGKIIIGVPAKTDVIVDINGYFAP